MPPVPCPVCDAAIQLEGGVVVAELITCRECGTALEVASLDPPALIEAPTEEEDWGE